MKQKHYKNSKNIIHYSEEKENIKQELLEKILSEIKEFLEFMIQQKKSLL